RDDVGADLHAAGAGRAARPLDQLQPFLAGRWEQVAGRTASGQPPLPLARPGLAGTVRVNTEPGTGARQDDAVDLPRALRADPRVQDVGQHQVRVTIQRVAVAAAALPVVVLHRVGRERA